MGKAVHPHVYLTGALKRMYAQRLGEGADLLADRDRIRSDLEHLGAVLRMFDPAINLGAIKSIRPRTPNRGRWNRTALKILRQASEPMRGRDLARRVMVAHGIDPNDLGVMFSIEASLQAVLLRLQRQGLIVTRGKPRRWAVTR